MEGESAPWWVSAKKIKTPCQQIVRVVFVLGLEFVFRHHFTSFSCDATDVQSLTYTRCDYYIMETVPLLNVFWGYHHRAEILSTGFLGDFMRCMDWTLEYVSCVVKTLSLQCSSPMQHGHLCTAGGLWLNLVARPSLIPPCTVPVTQKVGETRFDNVQQISNWFIWFISRPSQAKFGVIGACPSDHFQKIQQINHIDSFTSVLSEFSARYTEKENHLL